MLITSSRFLHFLIILITSFLFLIDNQIIPFAWFFLVQILNFIIPIFYEENYPFELLVRIFLLGLPGLFTSLAFAIDPLVYRSHYLALQIQTPLTSVWLCVICIIASYASLLGSYTSSKKILVIDSNKYNLFISNGRAISALFFCFIFSLIATFRSGSIIFTGDNYSSGANFFVTPFEGVIGVFQNISASFVVLHVYHLIRYRFFLRGFIFSSALFFLYFLPILTGQRADYLIGFLLALFLSGKILLLSIKQDFSFRNNKFTKILASLLLLFIVFCFARTLASFRVGETASFLDAFVQNIFHPMDLLVVNYGQFKVFYTETLNHVIGGIYSFTHKLLLQNKPFLLGASYLDYLPRLLPKFIRPPEIVGLEWQTDIDGMTVTQGGVFEAAESFYNFSLPGVFAISFLISKFLSSLRFVPIFAPWPHVLYLTVFLESFRYIWYQTFALVRIISIFLVFLFLLSFVFSLLNSNKVFR